MHHVNFQVIKTMNGQAGEVLTSGHQGHWQVDARSKNFATDSRAVDDGQKDVDIAQQMTMTVSNGIPCQYGTLHLPEHASQQR